MTAEKSESKENTVESKDDDLDELDLAIAELTGSDNIQKPPRIENDESFAKIFGGEVLPTDKTEEEIPNAVSVLERDFDSSDEEGVKNFLEQKYNQYGRELNKKLKIKKAENRDAEISREVNIHLNNSNNLFHKNKNRISNVVPPKKDATIIQNERRVPITGSFKPLQNQPEKTPVSPQQGLSKWLTKVDNSVYKDPVFNMRLVNPLVASNILVDRMKDKTAVSMAGLEYHIEHADLSQDWVIAGAIINKSPVKETKKGGSYSIWRISDLKGDIKIVSLFLFNSAYSGLWKTPVGSVIAILNPRKLDKRTDSSDVAALSIDKENQVMILGKSKDFGICKAKKKNGENCSAVVNLSECDYCIYHVKQEFGKMSKRSELQSSTAGRGLQELRNKILGKNEVFYGGQSFVAVPAKKSAKLIAKDQKRMMTLSEYYHNPNSANINHTAGDKKKDVPYASRFKIQSKIAGHVEVNMKQRIKDLERLKLLKEEDERRIQILNSGAESILKQKSKSPPNPSVTVNKPQYASQLTKSLNSPLTVLNKTPTLKKDNFSLDINFNLRKADAAKLKAIQILKNKPIEKSDPNFIKYRGTVNGKKRAIDELHELHNDPESKRRKLEEEIKAKEAKTRIQKIIMATSSHANLVNVRELEEQEKYFNKLEKKEQMEEKMLNTYKIACKAVICLKCKYTAFSASDRCKEEHHPLKVVDAEKRFFECQDCSNRTVSVDKMPKETCKNCKSSRWKRAAMIKERKLLQPGADLSIRGDEEQFLGSLNTKGHLNLLVAPEE
ncbi:protein MCM10 homolog [Condylostylus longicornis]|uniref:protein MCM10 homolog n=1 Tax=Condylostylus longicornis TaxID=2530218 RepID=UPI00244DAC42|nr:protein MCM10 homolog [Condylostylus longicornis]